MYLTMIVPFFAVVLTVASAGIVGAPVDAEMDAEAENALKYGMTQVNKMSNDLFVSQITKVIQVQKQIVAGVKYIFTVNVARTNCRKGKAETVCAIQKDPHLAKVTKCIIAVWSRPWIPSIEVVENTCP